MATLSGEKVKCHGKNSCTASRIQGGSVSIAAYQGASGSEITAAPLIEVSGSQAIEDAIIDSAGIDQMTVILSGQDASVGAIAKCVGMYFGNVPGTGSGNII